MGFSSKEQTIISFIFARQLIAKSNRFMKKFTHKIYLQIIILMLSISVFSQNENNKLMTSFVPKSKAYDIYYPKSFSLNEDNEGIVSITDAVSKLNITISSFAENQEIDDEKLIDQLSGFIKDQFNKEILRENWKSYKTKFDILVELKISDEKTNWVWWGVVNKKQLVLISINKETPILTEDTNLLQFMINNMIINTN